MTADLGDRSTRGNRMTAVGGWRRFAWIAILIVDAGFVAWGAMAALAPEHLLGPGSMPILGAEYEGFTGQSWSALASGSPMTAAFMTVIFRVYGAYNAAFGLMASIIAVTAFRRGDRGAWWALLAGNTITLVSAMIYDWTMNAIGPFEVTEYLGLVMIYGALLPTAPFLTAGQGHSGATPQVA